MVYGLGPRALRVHATLRERITGGEWPPGTRLPPHLELAAEFGVAPMTVRQVLGRLEEEGLVSRQPGRGTFVRVPARPAILVVDPDVAIRFVLADHLTRAGFRVLAASGPADGTEALASDPAVALVASGSRLPTLADGIDFIRAVRRRWPGLPLVALPTSPDDLAELHGTEEWPVLIVPKPVRLRQIDTVLRLVFPGDAASAAQRSGR